MKKGLFIKILIVITFFFLHNYVTNVLIVDFRYNSLSNSIQFFIISLLFRWIYRFEPKKVQLLNIVLLHVPLLILTAVVFTISWDRFFPEIFPCNLFFCSSIIFATFFLKGKKLILTIFLLLLSCYCISKYFVAEHYWNLLNKPITIESISKNQTFHLEGLDQSIVEYKYDNYTVSILEFGFIDCLPCRKLEPIFDLMCEKYISNGNVFIAKINPIDNIEYMQEHYGQTKAVFSDQVDSIALKVLKVNSFPHTIVIDSKGNVLLDYEGFTNGMDNHYIAVLTHKIDSLLNIKK